MKRNLLKNLEIRKDNTLKCTYNLTLIFLHLTTIIGVLYLLILTPFNFVFTLSCSTLHYIHFIS